MARRSSVQHRLARVFLTQLLLISVTTVLGVWATAKIVENVLVKEALMKEAEHFWSLYDQNPDQARPNTRHLLGLLELPVGGDEIPAVLSQLDDGYQRARYDGRDPLLYIVHRGNNRLYLIFDEKRVTALAFLFGVLPLTGVLLVIYIGSFQAWRRSRQLMSPLVHLAEILRRLPMNDPRVTRPDLASVEAEADSEVAVLVAALEAYAERLLSFVERERQFTRDASHELRTPLAVIRANLELLDRSQPTAALGRIDDTVEDMEALIETLLTLARSEHSEMPSEALVVNDLAMNLAERLQPLAERKDVEVSVEQKALLSLKISEVVLTIVLTNLVRNAINYSASGQVVIEINENDVVVRDSGRGMDAEELARVFKPFERGNESRNGGEAGHGLGLAIVHRLCERCAWQVEVASAPNEGTQVKIRFPAWQKV
ncbi:MAG: HAMP domain-containing histidine kinase [Gammaproteobacteria bacterium]|jgi:signal transduction histidine kinase|nr:HAMP domain-containing histidine kinase [Gammaproteobacteria bacterium]MBQ0773076.1 HAMP domain-containing histidine kinase [Gammaproteobacteria bacterium]|tara:strand:- start:126484 stop:127773 length:1290 start_codon:yes stop_codon:yes gene_type:complete